jgi:ubiquinone/menaquinone biosynthesis C-methylase UbiE
VHKFSPENADRLERPERHALLKPRETLRLLDLRPGMTVADVGAGTGFFSRPAADLVGQGGIVYAIDISSELLARIRRTASHPAVLTVQSSEFSIPLPDVCVDAALAAFVLHETLNRTRLLREVSRLMKHGARLLIVEWTKQTEENGPPEGERLDARELDEDLAAFHRLDAGTLNPSHYYRLVKKV